MESYPHTSKLTDTFQYNDSMISRDPNIFPDTRVELILYSIHLEPCSQDCIQANIDIQKLVRIRLF